MTVALPLRRRERGGASMRRAVLGRWLRLREVQLVLAMAAVVIASAILHPDFLAPGNISFMLADSAVTAILATGQTLVILGKGIDLSVAPILGICAVEVGFPAQNHNLNLALALMLVMGIGIMLGIGNGLLVSWARIPPIITTLATLSVYGGLQFILANGQEVVNIPNAYDTLGNADLLSGVPWVLVIAVGIAVAVALFLRQTNLGRSIYAVGNNADAAHRSGIAVRRIIFTTYVLSGLLAGIAGLIYLCHTGSADSTTGTDSNVELTSIAATLIGGTTLTGGRGGVIGSVLGAIFLSVALTAMVFARIPAIWEPAGVGALILLAMVTDRHSGTLASRARRRGGEVAR
ncbi:MAG: ABC transporter permease [Actinomycetota bacterium]|nr:ABC transporter permease [Actinomycetota bacterium]